VRNLPFSATEADVRAHFAAWGRLADVRLPADAATGRHRGVAFVLYVIPEQAVAALAEADGRAFQGRLLHVLPARPEPATPADYAAARGGGGGGGTEFQRKREAARRAGAGSAAEAASAWNTLFVRPDTTVAAVAEALGVGRGELLDRDSQPGASMAVRAALAETAIIAETKRFLREAGVHVPALQAAVEATAAATAEARARGSTGPGGAPSGPPSASTAAETVIARSRTTLLVKNLPFAAAEGAVRDLFARHGALARVVLPPSRAVAVVEFLEPRAAARALAALAYARFQRAPLYLEWAPEAVFLEPAPQPQAPPPAAAVAPPAAAAAVGTKRKRGELVGAEGGADAAAAAPEARPAKAPRKGGDGRKSAAAAAAEDDGTALGGGGVAPAAPSAGAAAPAAVEEATPGASTAAVAASSSTLYVKNLAWATTREGLRDLFAAAAVSGPLRAVRIPSRRNPKHVPGGSGAAAGEPERLSSGYGFVEFASRADAERALRSLQGRELDGHPLQLKLAAPGGGVGAEGGDGAGGAAAATAAAGAKGSKAGGSGAAAAAAAVAAGAADPSATKLLVRNLAFEATRTDLRGLFAPYGTLRSVRLPRKFSGGGRGFAFVDFLTHAEALAAVEALAATHLYGRHLVVEWADRAEAAGAGVGAAASATAVQGQPDAGSGGTGGRGKGKGKTKTVPPSSGGEATH